MITRAALTKNGRNYQLVQIGFMVYVLDDLGAHTGLGRYLPQGWTSFEIVREWLEELKYSQLTPFV
jgi:hypothetical protein